MQSGNINMDHQRESNLNLDEVAQRLINAFTIQYECYDVLWQVTKKISASIAMSKGNLVSIIPMMQKKQELVNQIEIIKQNSLRDIAIWKVKKHEATSDVAQRLDVVLGQVEEKILQFLKAEKQLEKQIGFYGKEYIEQK